MESRKCYGIDAVPDCFNYPFRYSSANFGEEQEAPLALVKEDKKIHSNCTDINENSVTKTNQGVSHAQDVNLNRVEPHKLSVKNPPIDLDDEFDESSVKSEYYSDDSCSVRDLSKRKPEPDEPEGTSNHARKDNQENFEYNKNIKQEQDDFESGNGDSQSPEFYDEENDSDYMEDEVIHFLAETSSSGVSKTRVKGGIKSGCKYKCDRCSSIFRYKSTLNYHVRSECGTKVIAGKKLVSKGNGKVLCNVCNKELCSRSSLMVHMRIHTGERPFECPHCGRSFFQNAHLKDHINKLHTLGGFLCRMCNATFNDKYQLGVHMKSHAPAEKPAHCPECDQSFTTKAALKTHFVQVHNESPNRKVTGYRCGACPAVLPNRCELKSHRDSHLEGPVNCQECGAAFTAVSQLKGHIKRNHRASLPCPSCPRTFPSRYDLTLHLRSHTGERPYPCNFCPRAFTRKSILDVHLTLHTGRKDFVCSDCGASFNRKSKLDVHRSEHTKLTVQCDICSKEFKCKSYLLSHLKTHGEGYHCPSPACHRIFKSPRGLRRHLKSAPVCSYTVNASQNLRATLPPNMPQPPPELEIFLVQPKVEVTDEDPDDIDSEEEIA